MKYNIKTFLMCGIIISMLFSTVSCSNKTTTDNEDNQTTTFIQEPAESTTITSDNSETKSTVNEDFAYTIDFPNGWKVDNSDSEGITYISDNYIWAILKWDMIVSKLYKTEEELKNFMSDTAGEDAELVASITSIKGLKAICYKNVNYSNINIPDAWVAFILADDGDYLSLTVGGGSATKEEVEVAFMSAIDGFTKK